MYLRIVSKYLITSLLILFMFSCGGGGAGGVQDSCAKDPKWYSNEDCPRNHLCGFGSAGSGNKSTAEFKSKSLARNDLAAAVSQVVIRELTSGFEELEGDAAEAWEKMLNSDNFVLLYFDIFLLHLLHILKNALKQAGFHLKDRS